MYKEMTEREYLQKRKRVEELCREIVKFQAKSSGFQTEFPYLIEQGKKSIESEIESLRNDIRGYEQHRNVEVILERVKDLFDYDEIDYGFIEEWYGVSFSSINNLEEQLQKRFPGSIINSRDIIAVMLTEFLVNGDHSVFPLEMLKLRILGKRDE